MKEIHPACHVAELLLHVALCLLSYLLLCLDELCKRDGVAVSALQSLLEVLHLGGLCSHSGPGGSKLVHLTFKIRNVLAALRSQQRRSLSLQHFWELEPDGVEVLSHNDALS